MEEILALLERIAKALEESNRINAVWFETSQAQRKEGADQRMVALYEQNNEREEAWRNEQRQVLSLHRLETQQRIAFNRNLLEREGIPVPFEVSDDRSQNQDMG